MGHISQYLKEVLSLTSDLTTIAKAIIIIFTGFVSISTTNAPDLSFTEENCIEKKVL